MKHLKNQFIGTSQYLVDLTACVYSSRGVTGGKVGRCDKH